MKFLPLLAALALTVSASADTWTGTINWRLDSLSNNAPSAQVGDVFGGWYSYVSPTPDGNFYNGALTGGINVPTWMSGSGFIAFSGYNISLTFTNGRAAFAWGLDYGSLSMNFYTSTMNFGDVGVGTDGSDVTGTGSVIFGSPVDQSAPLFQALEFAPAAVDANVPDGGNTLGLLGLAVAGLAMLRRRFVH